VSTSLEQLKQKALDRKVSNCAYVGDVTSAEIWGFLQQSKSFVVDVRTSAEWKFVGTPDLDSVVADLICLEWLKYPDFQANHHFPHDLTKIITDENAPIFFLCKTGGRSSMAASAMAQLGYKNCFNILNGFEGDYDDLSHRGFVNGWKAEGLPWKQQ
jgi:rhodanese-related sulfurtransferase